MRKTRTRTRRNGEADRSDEAYAAITTSATPSMRDAGGGAMGMSSRAGSCCSARKGDRRDCGNVENDTAMLR